MNDLNSNLKIAIDKIENNYNKHNNYFSNIYPFTTENISGYINLFNLKDKNLLTIGSSCDQVLNAIYCNCKDITAVDINLFTKYYFYLKMASILCLNREEFLMFLRYIDYPKVFKKNKYVFNKEIYEKVKVTLRYLDFESFLFWDELLNTYDLIKIRENLFNYDEYRTSVLEKCNLYLRDNDSYEILKMMIKKVIPTFITCDLKNFVGTKLYDNIWLSNVGQYLKNHELYNIVYKLSKTLYIDGQILVCYLYDFTYDTKYYDEWAEIYDLISLKMIFKEIPLNVNSFTGLTGIIHNRNDKDSVLIYKKVR